MSEEWLLAVGWVVLGAVLCTLAVNVRGCTEHADKLKRDIVVQCLKQAKDSHSILICNHYFPRIQN